MIRINGRTIYSIYKDSLQKSIVLLGDKEEIFEVEKVLNLADIKVDHVVDYDAFCQKDTREEKLIKSMQPNNQIFVLVLDDYFGASKTLQEYGFAPGQDFRWIKRYGLDNLHTQYMFDPNLGFNTLGNDDSPGFFTSRDKKDNDSVLVVLGGSSTDPGNFHQRPWTDYLQEMFDDAGIPVLIYNGAVAGYTASQEMIKLFRDVMALHPKYVVSLTGINNNHLVNKYPFLIDYNLKTANYFSSHTPPTVNMRELLPFKPLEHDKTNFDKYSFWLNQLKTMRHYCQLHDVEYHAFLQPNLMSKQESKLLREEREYLLNRSFMGRNGLTPKDYRKITLGFCEIVNKYNQKWLTDLTNIFDNEAESVYEDGIHTNERGNYLTAKAVFDTLVPNIKNDTSC